MLEILVPGSENIRSDVYEERVRLSLSPGSSKMSHTIDDEGAPSRPALLIERGILRESLLDKQNEGIQAGALTGQGVAELIDSGRSDVAAAFTLKKEVGS